MLYAIENNRLKSVEPEGWSAEGEGLFVGIWEPSAFEAHRARFHVHERVLTEWHRSHSAWFENGEGADYMSLALRPHGPGESGRRVLVVLRRNLLLFVTPEPEAILKLLEPLPEGRSLNAGRVLFLLMERMTAGGSEHLENIENEIADLENALLKGKRDCVQEIISLRGRLMGLKRYYEQLLDVLDDLMENENELLDEQVLQQFRIHDNRVDRLFHSVLNLRDYVTQVRESYQAEIDISLNNVMKIFTVITAIFLPLTLVVGWYGMNLRMPEVGWPYSYPVVIVGCLVIVALCIAYFRRHKWF